MTIVARDHRFNHQSIESHAPHGPGVYLIYRPLEGGPDIEIYVGQSDDISRQLLEHCRGRSVESACIQQYHPTRFAYELVWGGDKARREKEREWIDLCGPICK